MVTSGKYATWVRYEVIFGFYECCTPVHRIKHFITWLVVDNFPTFSHGLEFLNEAEKEKNNGKGDSASAPSPFASLSVGKMQF